MELHCETPLRAGARQAAVAETGAPGFLRIVLEGSQEGRVQPSTRVAPEIKPTPHSMRLHTPVKWRGYGNLWGPTLAEQLSLRTLEVTTATTVVLPAPVRGRTDRRNDHAEHSALRVHLVHPCCSP